MKKLFLILITIFTTLLLFSCGDDSDIPEGMQVVDGSSEDGYVFYAPEEWTLGTKLDGLAYVYVSRTNNTSVSFIEIDKSAFVKPEPAMSDEDFFLNHYFNSMKSEFPESTQWSEKCGETTLLGQGDTKADKAVKYTYSYLYEDSYYNTDRRIGFIQILASNNGRFYILTYSSPMAASADDAGYYDTYLEKFYQIVDNFKFYDTERKAPEKTEYPKDSDGDILASDNKLAGFDLYVPADFEVDYSSAIISATHADGSNITMTKATATGTTINNYWLLRKDQLEIYVDSITDIEKNPTAIEFANATDAAVCEYTYVYGGKTYHVYQIFCVSGGLMKDGYIFTYTASEDNYNLHLDDINRILAKVKF